MMQILFPYRYLSRFRAAAAIRLSASRFRHDHTGIAALEFALIVPIMLFMYIGTVEVTQGIIAQRRVNLLSRTLADLTSQSPATLDQSGMQAIFAASTAVMTPLSATGLKMRITSVLVKPSGQACVDWSDASNWSPLPAASSVTVPPGLGDTTATGSLQYIMAEVQYPYTPVMSYVIKPMTITDTPSYMRPRSTSNIAIVTDGSISGSTYQNPAKKTCT